MINGNEPAFSKAAFYHPEGGIDSPQSGLTKREYFAAMAMQGLVTRIPQSEMEVIAELSCMMADILIEQLNK